MKECNKCKLVVFDRCAECGCGNSKFKQLTKPKPIIMHDQDSEHDLKNSGMDGMDRHGNPLEEVDDEPNTNPSLNPFVSPKSTNFTPQVKRISGGISGGFKTGDSLIKRKRKGTHKPRTHRTHRTREERMAYYKKRYEELMKGKEVET